MRQETRRKRLSDSWRHSRKAENSGIELVVYSLVDTDMILVVILVTIVVLLLCCCLLFVVVALGCSAFKRKTKEVTRLQKMLFQFRRTCLSTEFVKWFPLRSENDACPSVQTDNISARDNNFPSRKKIEIPDFFFFAHMGPTPSHQTLSILGHRMHACAHVQKAIANTRGFQTSLSRKRDVSRGLPRWFLQKRVQGFTW